MAGSGVLGARIYIGDTPLVNIESAADALADFTSLTTVVEVGLIKSMTEFGKMFDLVASQTIRGGRTYDFKGGYNQGTIDMVVDSDLSDSGQALLRTIAVAQDQSTYPAKMTLNGAPVGFDTLYFGIKVFSYRLVTGTSNNVVQANIKLEINTDIFFETVSVDLGLEDGSGSIALEDGSGEIITET